MKKFLLTEALLLMLTSCGGNSGLETLGEVESYISDEPERALDKNYIDVADDSLINVAVEWYSHHGDADGRRTGRLQICPERDKVWMLIVSLQSARSG